MKKLTVFLMMFLFSLTTFAIHPSNREAERSETKALGDKIEVYYFHFSRRCVTCNAVESVTKEALQKYYPTELKNGKIIFKSLNLDEAGAKKIAEKLKVSGQTLLFVSGNKQKNLTNEGFMYAKSSPEKLKAKVKETISDLQKN